MNGAPVRSAARAAARPSERGGPAGAQRRRLRGSFASLRRRAGEERGTAMIEFALVATVLLMIVFGILYFGRFVGYTNDETHLAEIAARYAAVDQLPAGCASTLAQCIQQQAPGELQAGSGDVSNKAQVCISLLSGGSGQTGDTLQASVSASFHFLPILGFLNSVIPNPVTETADMRVEVPIANSSGILGCSS
jgi:hypothetical protein